MRQLAAIAVRVVGLLHGTIRQALPAATGAETGTPATAAERHDIRAIAFSPDGKFLLTAGDDGRAVLTGAQTGQAVRRLEGHCAGINAVAFSPDGRRLATGGGVLFHSDEVTRLWDSSSGQLVQRFAGHRSPVSSLAFSPDGKRLLTGSDDKTARLWDLGPRVALRRFAHRGAATAVAFAPDGKRLATATGATVIAWDASTGQELFRAVHPAAGNSP